MLPVVIPMGAFETFTFAIHRLKRKELSAFKVFCELSSMIETLVLCDHIHYFGVGAFSLEWMSGSMLPGQKLIKEIHPYKPFHGIDFITEFPVMEMMSRSRPPKQIELINPDIFNEMFKSNLEYDNNYNVSVKNTKSDQTGIFVFNYLATYAQFYNGELGNVSFKQYPLIGDLLPDLIRHIGSIRPIRNDPMILKAYDKLKQSYQIQLMELDGLALDIQQPIIPPITLILLDRLPSNCSDPNRVIDEIIELREELKETRSKFSDLEESFYSGKRSLEDLQKINKAISQDAKLFADRWNKPFFDNKAIQFFVDRLSFVVKLLAKRSDIELEDVLDELSAIIPNIRERADIRRPSHLFKLAMKTKQIADYSRLLSDKLGMRSVNLLEESNQDSTVQ